MLMREPILRYRDFTHICNSTVHTKGGDFMLLTVKEMEVLCIYHAGSLSATLEVLQGVVSAAPLHQRTDDIKSLAEKLSQMKKGDNACLTFEVKK